MEEAEQFKEGPLQPKKCERAFPDDFMRTQNMPTCQTFLPLRRGRFTRSLPGMHCDLVSWRTGLFKGLLTRPRRDEDPIAAPQWDELPTKRPGAPVPVSSTMKQHDACSPLQVSATLVPCEQRAATMQQSTAIQISGSPDLDLIQDIGRLSDVPRTGPDLQYARVPAPRTLAGAHSLHSLGRWKSPTRRSESHRPSDSLRTPGTNNSEPGGTA